ncbi:PA-phosphatase [Mycobacterium sp. 852013-51886_SCH5428379]|uniref:PA-phosphatase n=1 Tax=Mycobacterium sp. 852013-51886_SCH5428379 TaxID=1834111 RepID=UPI000ACCC72B|nr:PA-phosphatase [Mycobacterium sp. 852013-51886_SCH5428379]
MFALGWAVGRGGTRLDDRLLAVDGPEWLLRVTDTRVLIAALAVACGVALSRRRWRLAAVVAICPLVGIAAAQGLKRLFGRELEGALAYPSGHITALVVTVGMVVLVTGVDGWLLALAAVVIAAGMYAVGTTYHYFTDTVGAVLLGTAIVAVGARVADPPRRSS